MNDFYNELFFIACRETYVSTNDVPNREAIVLQAISELSEKEQVFICMLKPFHLECDPNGKISMVNVHKTCDTFHMNKNKIRIYKKEIAHQIIYNIKKILLKMF